MSRNETHAVADSQYVAIRSYAVAALKLVRNPWLPAYGRYFHFIGRVVGFTGDMVRVQVQGETRTLEGDWWALKRKYPRRPS